MYKDTKFPQTQLIDCATRGKTRDPRKNPSEEFSYIDIASVNNKTFSLKDVKILLGKDAPSRARKEVLHNDVIVATTRPYLRSISLIPEHLDRQICSTGFCVLRASENIRPEWLYYVVLSPRFMDQITPLMRGANYPAVTDKDILSASVPVPTLREQRRIVARIKECMELVDEAESLRVGSAEETRLLLRSYYHDLYEDLVASKPTRPLSDFGNIAGGGTPSKKRPDFWNGTIPWVSPKEMKVRDIYETSLAITDAAVSGSSVKLLEKPAVLFVVRGMILAHTLPVAVNRVPVTLNQDMKSITPNEGINVDFLAAMLRGAERRLLSAIDIAGHGTRRLKTETWSAAPIPDLDLDAQLEIVERASAVEALADQLAANIVGEEVFLLRDAILRKAFSGEL